MENELSPPPSDLASQSPSSPSRVSRWSSRSSLAEVTANVGATALGLYALKQVASLLQAKAIDPTIGVLLLAAVLLPSDVLSSALRARMKGIGK